MSTSISEEELLDEWYGPHEDVLLSSRLRWARISGSRTFAGLELGHAGSGIPVFGYRSDSTTQAITVGRQWVLEGTIDDLAQVEQAKQTAEALAYRARRVRALASGQL